MKKVLLINPAIKLPIETRHQPPLGLAYLAAVSEKAGNQVRVLDMDVDKRSLGQMVRDFAPDLIGISANTPQVIEAWRLAAQIKEIKKDTLIVLGGPHPSILPDESLQRSPADIVIRGEAEAAWGEICAKLEVRGSKVWFKEINGISYKDETGKVIHNPNHHLIFDVDKVPLPAYHLFQLNLYTSLQPAVENRQGRAFSIMTSRGCPYRCTYCCQSIFPQKWRARSPENVIAEWKWLVSDLNATEIGIIDDSFNIDRARLIKICDLLIENRLNHVPWIPINGMRADLVDLELFKKMKKAGCVRVAFGVESGNQKVLDQINKNIKLDDIRRAFRLAKEAKLETIGFFMLGLPEDTAETMDDTIRFAVELDPKVATFSMTTPFPGTALYEQVVREGRLLVKEWDQFIFFEGKARYEIGDLTRQLQEKKWVQAHRRFYLRPRRIFAIILTRNFWQNLPKVVKMAWRLIFKR